MIFTVSILPEVSMTMLRTTTTTTEMQDSLVMRRMKAMRRKVTAKIVVARHE